MDFEGILNGNPGMQMIFTEALDSLDNHKPLDSVQRVVVREWLNLARARRNELELKGQQGFLADDDYADLAALREMIDRLERI